MHKRNIFPSTSTNAVFIIVKWTILHYIIAINPQVACILVIISKNSLTPDTMIEYRILSLITRIANNLCNLKPRQYMILTFIMTKPTAINLLTTWRNQTTQTFIIWTQLREPSEYSLYSYMDAMIA